MAVGYSVVPLDDEIRGHLRDLGLETCPGADGRHPKPSEVRAVLQALGLHLEPQGVWDARLSTSWFGTVSETGQEDSGPWAALVLSAVRGEDEPAEIGFERGWSDLIVRILVPLAERSGPLVLFDDSGSAPLVISGDISAPELLERWG